MTLHCEDDVDDRENHDDDHHGDEDYDTDDEAVMMKK